MIRIVVPGPPPRKNSRAAVAYLTPATTLAWYSGLAIAVHRSLHANIPERLAKTGRWSVVIAVYEEKLRHLDDGTSVPLGDVDSTVSAVLDGLQPKRCGAWAPLDDDARVVRLFVEKHYDPDAPRVEITLEQLPPLHIEPRKTHRRKPAPRPKRKTP